MRPNGLAFSHYESVFCVAKSERSHIDDVPLVLCTNDVTAKNDLSIVGSAEYR
jgi:sugar lactone lactonase YvrE